MMHATLESTTDAILVTDEANYVREFNEKYIRLWGIPPHVMVSAHARIRELHQPAIERPGRYLARVQKSLPRPRPKLLMFLN